MALQPGVFVNVSQTPLAQSINNIPGEGQAAFAAAYNMGPVAPVSVQSWPQFVKLFGSFSQANGSLFHHSVYQFFANGGSSCYAVRVPNTDAATGSLNVSDIASPVPATPVPTTAALGGTVLAGTYKVEVTYVTDSGETTPSVAGSITTTGSTSTITVPSPPANSAATGWNVYFTAVGTTTPFFKQNSSPTAIGTSYTLTSPPNSGGANPPSVDTTDPLLTFTATSPGAWANKVWVALTTAGSVGGQARFNLLVYVGSASGNPAETFQSLSANPNDSRNVVSVVNSPYSGSQYVKVSYPDGSPLASGGLGYVSGSTDPAMITATALTGGADGSTAPTMGTAVQGLYDSLPDQILYVNLPGVNDTSTINTLLDWADSRGDVMVIIDGPAPTSGETSAEVASTYATLVGSSGINADSNAVVYAPWLLVLDPSSSVVGATRFVPPGGAALGVWQRGLNQFGVQQAPAGTWATLACQDLEVRFTDADLQSLNTAQVNAIKMVPNTGFCIFGARTLGIGLPSRYVSVQRSLIQFSHDMENLLAFATFQPNDSTLWQAITSVLTAYLTQKMQDGALAGNTPATSFIVICDGTVNTPTTAQAGVVNVTVGVALVSPAEFIMIDLQQLSASASATS